MKKIIFSTLLAISLATPALAKESSYIDKVTKLWTLKTNGLIEFNTTKVEDGYKLKIYFKNRLYNKLLSGKEVKLKVDEGPLITTPKVMFGIAGLSSKGSVLDILNDNLKKDIAKDIKSKVEYNYDATISYSKKFNSKLRVSPVVIDNNTSFHFKMSEIVDESNFDLDSFTGRDILTIKSIENKPKKEGGKLLIKDLSIDSKITQEPIKDYMLFANTNISIADFDFTGKLPSTLKHIKLSINASSDTVRVDRDLMDIKLAYNIKAKDEKTIALAKGVKESKFKLELKNLGIDGVIGFAKFSDKVDKAQEKIYLASASGNKDNMKKAYANLQEITNSIVPLWNKTFITNKSKILLDLELKSDKTSYIKLDLTYKGKPLSGNIQSAMLSLASQQLELFDGTFDIVVDSSIASAVNPFAIMGLDMLKSKGFATLKDGLYRFKGELKGGKIVINGKEYTLPELSRALF